MKCVQRKVLYLQTDNHTLEGLMGQIIGHLFNSGLYEDDSTSDPHVPTVSSPEVFIYNTTTFCVLES